MAQVMAYLRSGFIGLVLISACPSLLAQTQASNAERGKAAAFATAFAKAFDSGDTVRQLDILLQWKTAAPANGDWYAARFNYGYARARTRMMTMQSERPSGESFAFSDSTGETVGYIGETVLIDSAKVALAMQAIDEGIERFPDRLDLRLGKAYALREMQDWSALTETLVQCIRQTHSKSRNWLWTSDQPGPPSLAHVMSIVQSYQNTLYQTGDDRLLPYMRRIALAALDKDPVHLESLSNMAISYMAQGSHLKGLEWLLRAEAVAPSDPIVLNNIAIAYLHLEQPHKAIPYFEKLLQCGDEALQEFARERLYELQLEHLRLDKTQ
jgi:tetratricopeptide (TPR) repeat protein